MNRYIEIRTSGAAYMNLIFSLSLVKAIAFKSCRESRNNIRPIANATLSET